MKYIKHQEINRELTIHGRTYLTGDLKFETDLNYIRSSGYETGISRYETFKYDQAHTHTWNQEYNFVIKGEIKVFIFEENKEYHFVEGDFFNIEPGMSYMSKCKESTEIFFSKSPGGNDKEIFDISNNPEWIEWSKGW